MKPEEYHAPSAESSGDLDSARKYQMAIHREVADKRNSIREIQSLIKIIYQNLPEETKRKIGNQINLIGTNPVGAIEIVKTAIEADREKISRLDNAFTADDMIGKLDALQIKFSEGDQTVH